MTNNNDNTMTNNNSMNKDNNDMIKIRRSMDETMDRIFAMRRQQETTYRIVDYLGNDHDTNTTTLPRDDWHDMMTTTTTTSNHPNGQDPNLVKAAADRTVMVEWFQRVLDFFPHLDRELAAIAVNYLDRLVGLSCQNDDDYYNCQQPQAQALNDSNGKNNASTNNNSNSIILIMDVTTYRLVATTCLYVAVKVHGPVSIPPSIWADLSRGQYHAKDIEQTEALLLQALCWNLGPPTALAFVRHGLELMEYEVQQQQRLLQRGQQRGSLKKEQPNQQQHHTSVDDDSSAHPSTTNNNNNNNLANFLQQTMVVEALLDLATKQCDAAIAEPFMMATPPSIVAYCALENALVALLWQYGNGNGSQQPYSEFHPEQAQPPQQYADTASSVDNNNNGTLLLTHLLLQRWQEALLPGYHPHDFVAMAASTNYQPFDFSLEYMATTGPLWRVKQWMYDSVVRTECGMYGSNNAMMMMMQDRGGVGGGVGTRLETNNNGILKEGEEDNDCCPPPPFLQREASGDYSPRSANEV